MILPNVTPPLFRFGVFELDTVASELRRDGIKVHIADQPIRILQMLLERPGELVTRSDLRQRLWTPDTYVDFDIGLNAAVCKLRDALGDSADNPRFIQTLPRRGYRFIAPITRIDDVAVVAPRRSWRRRGYVAVAGLAIVSAAVAYGHGGAARSRSHPRRAVDVRAVDPAAYNLFIKGVEAGGRESYSQFRDAVAYYEQAIARQPEFAEAHAGLAYAQLQLLFGGPLSPREVIPKAEAAARKAIELDATLAQPHRTLGFILGAFYWNWDDATREARRAHELTSAFDVQDIQALIRDRRFDEAVAIAERSREHDPRSFDVYHNLALAYRARGDFDRAVTEIRHGIDLQPEWPRGYFQLGATLALMGHPEAAIPALERAVSLSPLRNPRFKAYLGYAYAAAGRPDDARRILAALEALAREQYVSSFGIALINDALGEKERAIVAFERACDERALELAQIAQYPPFATIAGSPRVGDCVRLTGTAVAGGTFPAAGSPTR